MKSKIFAVIGVALLSVLVLTACGGGNQPAAQQPAEATTAPAENQAADITVAPADGASQSSDAAQMTATAEAMDALIKEKVAGHHDLGRIYNANKTRAEWEATLDRMISYGAKINDQEKEMIIDYLLSRQSN